MLHSLNSIRVLAEFWVVHMHLAPNPHGFAVFFTRDLMSFFFVLSGFVMTHTHLEDDLSTFQAKRQFWWRRFSKTYPIFLLFWLIGFCESPPLRRSQMEDLPCHLIQLTMISSWMGCELRITNGPSWYITVLWWIWLAFPWILPCVRRWGVIWPWCQILIIHILAVGCVALIQSIPYWTYATFPPLRLLEFYIGCIAATVAHTRLHWVWPTITALFLVAFYIAEYYVLCSNNLCAQIDVIPCDNTLTCILAMYFASINKFAILWVVLIHWLATSELHDIPNRRFRFLENSNLLQTLSTYSLQLYLGHVPLSVLLYNISKWISFEREWEFNLMFIAVYWASYGIKIHIQPLMDSCMETISRCCEPRIHTLPDQPAV